MITLTDVYHVIASIIPLYVAMTAALLSIKWWKLFTPDQCSGINKFVANFSIPLLSFKVISSNNPYKMNLKLVSADFLQKFLALIILAAIAKIRSRGSLSWVITGLSLSTLPNTLILGLPLIEAMYGKEASTLLAQIVVLQSLIWYNLLLVLFEINATEESINATSSSEVTGMHGEFMLIIKFLLLDSSSFYYMLPPSIVIFQISSVLKIAKFLGPTTLSFASANVIYTCTHMNTQTSLEEFGQFFIV